MSVGGQKATFPCLWRMSALPQKADIEWESGGSEGNRRSPLVTGRRVGAPELAPADGVCCLRGTRRLIRAGDAIARSRWSGPVTTNARVGCHPAMLVKIFEHGAEGIGHAPAPGIRRAAVTSLKTRDAVPPSFLNEVIDVILSDIGYRLVGPEVADAVLDDGRL